MFGSIALDYPSVWMGFWLMEWSRLYLNPLALTFSSFFSL